MYSANISLSVRTISDDCTNKQGKLRYLVLVSSTIKGGRFPPEGITRNRYIEVVSVNNVWKVQAITYSKTSNFISQCSDSKTNDPTFSEHSKTGEKLQIAKTDLKKIQKVVATLKKQVATLKKQKEEAEKALVAIQEDKNRCANDNSRLNEELVKTNRRANELALIVQEFEREKLARLEAERAEAEKQRNARLALDQARKQYNALLKEENEIKGKPQTADVWRAFYAKEKEVVLSIWQSIQQHMQYLNSKDNLMLVEIIGNNMGNIIEFLSPQPKDATNIANRLILKALGSIVEEGDYQDLGKADKIIENIEEYVKVQKQIKDIEMDLRRAVADFNKRKKYNSALRTFIQNEKYLTRMPAELQYQVKYQQGIILLWNLGNVANSSNLAKGKTNNYILNRRIKGLELLDDVRRNAQNEDLQQKATIAMVKYKY